MADFNLLARETQQHGREKSANYFATTSDHLRPITGTEYSRFATSRAWATPKSWREANAMLIAYARGLRPTARSGPTCAGSATVSYLDQTRLGLRRY
jgi:hypothetical protein